MKIRLTANKKCPKCGSVEYVRIPRSSWMRIFKNSYLFECNLCRSEFLYLHSQRNELVASFLEESGAGITSS